MASSNHAGEKHVPGRDAGLRAEGKVSVKARETTRTAEAELICGLKTALPDLLDRNFGSY